MIELRKSMLECVNLANTIAQYHEEHTTNLKMRMEKYSEILINIAFPASP